MTSPATRASITLSHPLASTPQILEERGSADLCSEKGLGPMCMRRIFFFGRHKSLGAFGV